MNGKNRTDIEINRFDIDIKIVLRNVVISCFLYIAMNYYAEAVLAKYPMWM